MSINNLAINAQSTADNLIGTTDSSPLLRRSFHSHKLIQGPQKLETRTLSGCGTCVGVAPYTEVGGTYTCVGAPTLTVDVTRVNNYNNKYVEYFTTDTFKSSDTGTEWGDGDIGVGFNSSAETTITSESIFKNEQVVFKVKITAKGTNVSNLLYSISANAGVTWQSITYNELVDLTTTGEDLRFKVTNGSGAGAGWPTAWGTWGTSGSSVEAQLNKLFIAYEV